MVKCFDECLLYSLKLNQDRVLSGSIFGNVILWDKFTGHCIFTFWGHTGSIFDVAFLTENRVAACSDDRLVKSWDTKNHICLHTMVGHQSRVWKMVQMDDYLVSSSEDTNAIIWNLETGEHVWTLEGHYGKSVWSVAVSKELRQVATGGSDSSIKIWPLEPLELAFEIWIPEEEQIRDIWFMEGDSIWYFISTNIGKIYSFCETKRELTIAYSGTQNEIIHTFET